VPYSVKRLLRLCRTWRFESEVDELSDCEDGEPRAARAFRRIKTVLKDWRDRHGADKDPWFDESKQEFHVCDVAIIFDDYRRLRRLEMKVIDALGPETTRMRWNRKRGEFEPE
jgi:hypothetical protein